MSLFKTWLQTGFFAYKAKKVNYSQLQFATYTLTPANTNLTIQRKNIVLTSFEQQDLLVLTNKFVETIKICQSDDKPAASIIDLFIYTEYTHITAAKTTLTKKFESLLFYKYLLVTSILYIGQLTLINQNDFYTIKDYYQEIINLLKKLKVSMGWTINDDF